MANVEDKPSREETRPVSKPNAWLIALADETTTDSSQGATTIAGFEIDGELSALLDQLAFEGPVRGKPFV